MTQIKYVSSDGFTQPKGIVQQFYADGNTEDIIKTIMYADKRCKPDTAGMAQSLKRSTPEETVKAVWHFVKHRIKYVLDPLGKQFVKAPAVTWKHKYADCKSRSIMQASLLKNLGIKAFYRFAAYEPGDYKHVYVVVLINGKLFVSDPDMPEFNTEKPKLKKLDIPMSEIVYMAGANVVNNTHSSQKRLRLFNYLKSRKRKDPTVLDLRDNISGMNDFEWDLAILKQRDALNKQQVERIAGIGCLKAEKFQDRIDMTNDMIHVMRDDSLTPDQKIAGIGIIAEMIEQGEYNSAKSISGIGSLTKRSSFRKNSSLARKQKIRTRINSGHIPQIGKISLKKIVKKAANAVKKTVTAPTKLAVKVTKGITKAAVKVTKTVTKGALKATKAVAKGVLKTITAPAQLAAKATLELLLPKMAPTFLYLFIKDPALIAKLPAKAQKKRKKSEKLAKFITGAIGMKEAHFLGIVRNGIQKHYGKSPESVLEGMIGSKVSGVGVLPAILAILPVIMKVIKLIGSVFKKKDKEVEDFSANDIPDQSDFADITTEESTEMSRAVKQQPDVAQYSETDSYAPDTTFTGEQATQYPSDPALDSYTTSRGVDPTSSADRRSNKVC